MVDIIIEYEAESSVENTEEIIRNAAEAALLNENVEFDTEISVTVTDNAGIRELNREYRNIDKETDVLSFPMYDFEEPSVFDEAELALEQGAVMLGDIIVSTDKICEQAEEYGHSTIRELSYLMVHSMLHLLGYDHIEEEDKKLMRSREDMIMERLGILR